MDEIIMGSIIVLMPCVFGIQFVYVYVIILV